jgi:hypothetical protein
MYSGGNTVSSPYNQQAMQQSTSMLQRQMPSGGSVGMNMSMANQSMAQQQGIYMNYI